MNIVKDKRGLQENVGLQTANTLITTLTVIFLIGALGGLGILIGSGITAFANSFRPDEVLNVGTWLVNAVADLIWSFGNLLSILGTLIELFIGALAGIVTAFGLAGIIGTLFGNGLRRITGPLSHILAGVMGAISGAILMAVMALFGLWASLLGILPLLIGGFLGGQALLQVVSALLHQNSRNIEKPDRWRNMLHSLIWNIGFVVVFLFLFNRLSLGRSLVDGTLPPQTPARILGIQLGITAYLLNAMLTGAILGGISGLLAGLQAAFPLGNLLYNTSRSALNMVRSIEPLIMGLVFVIWVGVGPFAGVLALTLHSIASLGKLYSEQIENIDPGPIEALQSTGANQLQTIIYAVVPQIIPPYIAFTMYRWDINVRMSTIIGFVGGGGIGLLLQQQINLLRYRDAGVAVLAIAVVVSILDYTSAAIRERLT